MNRNYRDCNVVSNNTGFVVFDGAVYLTQLIRRMKIMPAGMHHRAVLRGNKQQDAENNEVMPVVKTFVHI